MSRFDFAFRAVAWTTVIIGAGYGCMTFLSPSREELLKRLPAGERKDIESKMEARHKKTGELFEVLQRNIQSEQPIWKVYHQDKITQLDAPPSATE